MNCRSARRSLNLSILVAIALLLSQPLMAEHSPATNSPVILKAPDQNNDSDSELQIITLKEAITEALNNNQRIRAAAGLLNAAADDVRRNRAKLYGELNVSLSFQALNDKQLLRPLAGPVSPSAIGQLPFAQYQLHSGVTYSYPLYTGGKLAYQIGISKDAAELARLVLANSSSDVVFNVTSLYVEAVALQKQCTAIDAELQELSSTENHIRVAVGIGKIAGVDLLKVTDRIEEARAQRATVTSRQTRILAMLSAVLGRNDVGMVKPRDLPDSLPELTATHGQLLAKAAKSFRVLSSAANVDQAQTAVKLTQSDLMPSVQLQMSYFEHTNPNYPLNSQDTWLVGVQVALPLMDGGERRAVVAAAKDKLAAARAQDLQSRLDTIAELTAALAAWDAAHQQVTATEAQVKAADEVARIEQLRYETGAGNIEDLLRARTRQTSAQSNCIEAVAQVFIAAAEINHVVSAEVVK